CSAHVQRSRYGGQKAEIDADESFDEMCMHTDAAVSSLNSHLLLQRTRAPRSITALTTASEPFPNPAINSALLLVLNPPATAVGSRSEGCHAVRVTL
ncbi:hypothetical protein B296_00041964, partial [Ensete ventricosum]